MKAGVWVFFGDGWGVYNGLVNTKIRLVSIISLFRRRKLYLEKLDKKTEIEQAPIGYGSLVACGSCNLISPEHLMCNGFIYLPLFLVYPKRGNSVPCKRIASLFCLTTMS